MENLSPFAQVPATPQAIVTQIRRQLDADTGQNGKVSESVLDRVADEAVRQLWDSRVKTFVPVLALRQAREWLRDQDVVVGMSYQGPQTAVSQTVTRDALSQPKDVLSVEDDVLPRDEQDNLSV
jgi:hypothetical protein